MPAPIRERTWLSSRVAGAVARRRPESVPQLPVQPTTPCVSPNCAAAAQGGDACAHPGEDVAVVSGGRCCRTMAPQERAAAAARRRPESVPQLNVQPTTPCVSPNCAAAAQGGDACAHPGEDLAVESGGRCCRTTAPRERAAAACAADDTMRESKLCCSSTGWRCLPPSGRGRGCRVGWSVLSHDGASRACRS